MSELQKALVIGGGIAGIQASLDLANRGIKVYLVEKSPTIGGRMAQLDKTFPTLDCSICILAPKMIDCLRHPNIKLLTYSEVTGVEGSAGNFTVKILKKPRYVDEEKCTGCASCVEVCPVKAPNEWNEGIDQRRAVYISFPQAVPRIATIDEKACLKIKFEKPGKPVCGKCVEACGASAINFDMKPETIDLTVGAIIVANGFELFDARKISEYGYGRYKDILTSLEFERLVCATGPTGGHLVRLSDNRVPKRIVFIQCVGSRSQRGEIPYCSTVCCTYATKEAILIKEHEPECDVHILYIDMRAIGKGFQEFVNRAEKEWGIKYTKGHPSTVEEDPTTGELVIRYEDITKGEIKEITADLVVLCPALVPRRDNEKLAKILKVELDEYGFFKSKYELIAPLDTNVPGIFMCGYCQSPKDIPESVAQSSGAAARVAEIMAG